MWDTVILFIVGILGISYMFIKKQYSHWADQGITYDEPVFPYGSLKGVGSKIHTTTKHKQMYDDYKKKSPVVGMYMFIQPALLITDLELVKNILVRDFNNFVNRGVYYNDKDDPLSAHLFAIEDQKWRNLRAKLTPTFTSGKMKMMFPTIVAVADEFKKCIDTEMVKGGNEIEMKEILARFTTDVIGTCAFGLDCNSLVDPEAEFRTMGREILSASKFRLMRSLFLNVFKNLGRKLHMKTVKEDVAEFFMNAVKDTIEFREKNNVRRNDFMDLLIKLKNEGSIDNGQGKTDITINEIAAQAFVFFLAGFETSSTAMSYAIYELSLNQEVQERGRQEVQRILEKYNGEMTYEAVLEMKYIDQIINESLRKYPPVGALVRTASEDYKISGTKCVLKKGQLCFIPVYAIQHDEEFYPNPEEFNPDNFSDENVKKRNPYAFLPFGEGPRVCIGLRFGMMQARIGLATLLVNYKFEKCSRSVIPLNFLPNSVVLTPDSGLYLNVQKL